ncbi:hypothetical protein SAMCCGM7_Ch2524 [Sinorhizobium americanum CCGM7]|nr:hypothetical protein SAMCCGM7_Ch2524 [Sinorhizobium americanum CCGM7]
MQHGFLPWKNSTPVCCGRKSEAGWRFAVGCRATRLRRVFQN